MVRRRVAAGRPTTVTRVQISLRLDRDQLSLVDSWARCLRVSRSTLLRRMIAQVFAIRDGFKPVDPLLHQDADT